MIVAYSLNSQTLEGKRDSLDYFKCGCMRYLSLVSVLATVDGGQHALSKSTLYLEYFHLFTLLSGGLF